LVPERVHRPVGRREGPRAVRGGVGLLPVPRRGRAASGESPAVAEGSLLRLPPAEGGRRQRLHPVLPGTPRAPPKVSPAAGSGWRSTRPRPGRQLIAAFLQRSGASQLLRQVPFADLNKSL